MKLRVVPSHREEANELVTRWHRHHKRVQGYRFAMLLVDETGEPHGAVIVGRPVTRHADPRMVAEVTRLVTDGTPNGCSKLYAAAARACRAMGFERIQTFTLLSEPGTSLRASGWTDEGPRIGRQWKHTDGRERRTDQPTEDKRRWSLDLQ